MFLKTHSKLSSCVSVGVEQENERKWGKSVMSYQDYPTYVVSLVISNEKEFVYFLGNNRNITICILKIKLISTHLTPFYSFPLNHLYLKCVCNTQATNKIANYWKTKKSDSEVHFNFGEVGKTNMMQYPEPGSLVPCLVQRNKSRE